MKSKITVGVTGGIGSGKSFVCKILENMGYPVFYSDKVSKSLLSSDANIKTKIVALLGEQSYRENGSIDKGYIASQIFNDDIKLKAMNAIMHPAVRKAFKEFAQNQENKIIFNEAAILFETGAYDQFNKTMLITAPKAVKMTRILKREKITEAEIESRMAKQWTDDQKKPLANYIVQNGENDMLLPQLSEILADILA